MFNEDNKITAVASYAAAAQTDVTCTSVDMTGYAGVIFIGKYSVAAADNFPHLEQSANNSDWADIAGSSVGVASSDETVWVEVKAPLDRYVRAIFQRGTSSAFEAAFAIQYGARSRPVDNTVAGTIHGEAFVSPAEGTK